MQVLNDLLKAVIDYQDGIDTEDYGLKAKLKIAMLEAVDEAAKKFPETIAMYNFNDHKDVQMEFDCIQEYIDDFFHCRNKILAWRDEKMHYPYCCTLRRRGSKAFSNQCDCNMTKELSDYRKQKETSA